MPTGSTLLEKDALDTAVASDDALWYADLLRRGNAVAALWRDAAIWPLLAAGCLIPATFLVAWTNISLMRIAGPASVPIDLGWGIHIPFITYGTLCVAALLWCLWRGLVALPWCVAMRAGSPLTRCRPLTPRALVGMGGAALAIPVLYLFQFLFADFGRVTRLATQENESLLLRAHLGYAMPRTHLVFTPFQFDVTSLGDRWALFVQVSDLGVLLPILAAALCWVGAVRLLRARSGAADASDAVESAAEPTSPRLTWFARHRRAVIVSACIVGAVVLARPVAANVSEWAARASLDSGNFDNALTLFDRAALLDPAITDLPGYHQDRGAALWALGNPNTQDAQLYLAAQQRALNDLNGAWATDAALRVRYPTSPAVEHDLALTYEELAEQYNVLDSTQVDDQGAPRNPQVFTSQQNLTGALPWLDRLIALEPDNVYALYARGRILYRLHDYQLAAADFTAILPLAGDDDMRSASYTYLALCRGGLGDYIGERTLLLTAVEFDHGYNNTTARENASGLH